VKYKFLIISILILLSFKLFSQHEADYWYFGNNAGIDFSSGNAEPLTNGQLKNLEGSATISDSTGNLLFYTNGMTVWNKEHQIMENGTGLFGDPSSTQSAIIIPKPNIDSVFYIFTVDVLYKDGYPDYQHKGLNFSIVNTKRNNGNGEVIQKNTQLLDTVTEKITAVKHKNGTDIWLITHDWGNNNFYSWLITENGISSSPVISSTGTVHEGPDPFYVASIGYLKASPNGNKIVVAILGLALYELFDFDNETGVISNPITFNYPLTSYGCEFSPDCSKLYMSDHHKLMQADLNAGTSSDIIASVTEIAEFESIVGALQLANNGKLYISTDTTNYLSVINYPDSLPANCGFENNALYLDGKKSSQGLPDFIQSYFKKASFKYENRCLHDSTHFTINNISEIDSVIWNFNDILSGSSNISKDISPYHIFSEAGIYKVNLTIWYNNISNNYYENVKIIPLPKLNLGNDTTLCITNNYTLNAYSPHLSYLWNDASTDSILEVNTTNKYWVEIQNIYTTCKNSDTINIIFSEVPEINLGNDTSFCENSTFKIDAFHENYTYVWQDNSTNSFFETDTAGIFFVEVSNLDNCKNSDTISLFHKHLPRFNFGNDTTICEDLPLLLSPNLNDDTKYIWQDESTNASFLVTEEGFYKLTTSNICGTWSDSINISTKYCGDIYIPNIFTPTNDGINELFKIKGIEEDAWELTIYSRWGEEVYYSSDYQNDWNGNNVSPAVYYYILSNNKTNEEYKGTVRVVKAK